MHRKHTWYSPILKFGNDHNWAKRFFCGQKCSILHFSEHGRLKKESYEIQSESYTVIIILQIRNMPLLNNFHFWVASKARQNYTIENEFYLCANRILISHRRLYMYMKPGYENEAKCC